MRDSHKQLSRRELLLFRLGGLRTPDAAEESSAREPSGDNWASAKASGSGLASGSGKASGLPRFLRPPGARAEDELIRLCDGCGECVTACPEHAITLLGPEYGRTGATPAILPTETPCRACVDAPCVTACAPGALSATAPRVTKQRIAFDPGHCWATLGQPCDYCVTACPVDPPALEVQRLGGVVIAANACVGCGLCIFYCTATPRALHVA